MEKLADVLPEYVVPRLGRLHLEKQIQKANPDIIETLKIAEQFRIHGAKFVAEQGDNYKLLVGNYEFLIPKEFVKSK